MLSRKGSLLSPQILQAKLNFRGLVGEGEINLSHLLLAEMGDGTSEEQSVGELESSMARAELGPVKGSEVSLLTMVLAKMEVEGVNEDEVDDPTVFSSGNFLYVALSDPGVI